MMKSEKGISLISLTIYVIVMAIVIAVFAILTTFFYKNTKTISDISPLTEYTTFNSYFTDEVNHSGLKIVECAENYIVFSNGVQYTFVAENQGIYRNQVKICSGIENCTFSEAIENGKPVVKVTFKSGNQDRNNTYTLR